MVVVNLFALRATDPAMLLIKGPLMNVVGEYNDDAIRAAVKASRLVVLAWGNGGGFVGRGQRVEDMIKMEIDHPAVAVLGRTKLGQPRHPLYVFGGTNYHLETGETA